MADLKLVHDAGAGKALSDALHLLAREGREMSESRSPSAVAHGQAVMVLLSAYQRVAAGHPPIIPADPLSARRISCGACKHGTVTIYLHGEDGAVFAQASMPLETAIAFNDDYVDVVERAVLGVSEAVGGERPN